MAKKSEAPADSGNRPRPQSEAPQVKLETLQAVSFELITKSVVLWRTYSDTEKSKGPKIDKAVKIHGMLIDAMRFHPDIKQLRLLSDMAGEVQSELESLRKIHPISPGSKGTKGTRPTKPTTAAD